MICLSLDLERFLMKKGCQNSALSHKEYLANKESFPDMALQDNNKIFDAKIIGNKKRAHSPKQTSQLFEFMAGCRKDKDGEVYSKILGNISNYDKQVQDSFSKEPTRRSSQVCSHPIFSLSKSVKNRQKNSSNKLAESSPTNTNESFKLELPRPWEPSDSS